MTKLQISRYNSLLWQTRAQSAAIRRQIDAVNEFSLHDATAVQIIQAEARLADLEAQLAGNEKLLAWIVENGRAGALNKAPVHVPRRTGRLANMLWLLRWMGTPIRL